MHYIVVRDDIRKKKVKRKQTKFQHRGFLLHSKLQPCIGVKQTLKTLVPIGAAKPVTKKKYWRKREMEK